MTCHLVNPAAHTPLAAAVLVDVDVRVVVVDDEVIVVVTVVVAVDGIETRHGESYGMTMSAVPAWTA